MTGFFEEVDGTRIHYEKVGRGTQILLMIPGAIGTARTDFPDQIGGGLDQSLFTMIIIDLPGFGKSRPPERVHCVDQYRNDAAKAAGLMEKLGYTFYSVLGWSDGVKPALLLAINQQARVDKLVVWGGHLYITSYDLRAVKMFRDVRTFDPRAQKLYADAYGQELFEELWHKHVDFYANYSGDPSKIFDVRREARSIRCPTLILHGDKDSLLDKIHPHMIEREIADSRLVIFPNGTHELHQVFVKKFNKIVTDFLLE